jgi:FAD/FMN-containing dehydrogenase
MDGKFEGEIVRRGEAAYEACRRASVWNARTPERYPAAIVRPASVGDVVLAVGHAREHGLSLTVRSGGHSWAGSHLRDGCLLIDMSASDAVRIDPDARRAMAGPGVKGTQLAEAAAEHDLFFPVGHCPGVSVGGYLLQGGFGWNSRVLGPACASVAAVEVVTAAGERLRASADENEDLFWAARGAGPGFFAVVTAFELELCPKPRVLLGNATHYAIEQLDDVFHWAHEVGPRVPREMELMLVVHRDALGHEGPGITVTGPVFADSEAQARELAAILDTCPARDKAVVDLPQMPAELQWLIDGVGATYPDDHRYAVDNMWTSASIDVLLPGLHRIAETMPPATSHMLWMNWGPSPERPDMAYSMEDETYIALYAVYTDPAEDEAMRAWATDRMAEMEHLATGVQLADENLGERPMPFVSDENLHRLDELRDRYDPDGLFCPWMGRPWPARS